MPWYGNNTLLMFRASNTLTAHLTISVLKRPVWRIGDRVWVYNEGATIRQGMSKMTDDKALKAKLSLN